MLKASKNQSHVIADLYFKDSLNPSPRINLFWDDLLENNLFIKSDPQYLFTDHFNSKFVSST